MKTKRIPTKETRLNAIAAFYGNAGDFADACQKKEKVQRVRTFSQEYAGDLQTVLRILARMRGMAVVIHGPRGCLSLLPEDLLRGQAESRWAVTDLRENDVILGGEEKLRHTVRHLVLAERPAFLFIVTTPPVSVNNDDTPAVAEELQTELGVPIIVIPATGFRSKLGAMGSDETLNALSALLPPPDGKKRPAYVNLLSVGEIAQDIGAAARFLNSLGYAVNILPDTAGPRQLALASGAEITLVFQPEEGWVLADFLEKRYGVPAFSPAPPIGFEGTEKWEQAVCERLGRPLPSADRAPFPQGRVLEGLRIYLAADAGYAAAYRSFLESLGAVICGITVPFLNEGSPAAAAFSEPGAPFVHAAQGQAFELKKIWATVAPDLILCQRLPPCLSDTGIPILSAEALGLFGREAASRLLRAVLAAKENRRFFSQAVRKAPYRAAWLKKRADWHIKLEVS